MNRKRVFLIILDSLGIGEMPDAEEYGDTGSNTLAAILSLGNAFPNLQKLGLFNIEGVPCGSSEMYPIGAYARMKEVSKGKDSTIGHWEIACLPSDRPLPTYPKGFPSSVLQAFSEQTGRGVLCNMPYSGTDVIRDYGEEQLRTGKWIVYTSADSVFQIAAHEEKIPIEELYDACRKARKILTGENAVGRVIARPYIGKYPHFERTAKRHDFSLEPPGVTMLDCLKERGLDVLSIGKIQDIFAGRGITKAIPTAGNTEGLQKTAEALHMDFNGLCFVNLVDFDTLYGHRNDRAGYWAALKEFDDFIPVLLAGLGEEDLLMIAADHGCDPLTPSTDHSREYVPWLIAGQNVKKGMDLGTLPTFSDIGATILDYLGASVPGMPGTSRLSSILEGSEAGKALLQEDKTERKREG